MPFVEIQLEDVFFDPKVQKMCVSPSFTCPNYNNSWSCPPEAPYLKEKVSQFKKLYLFYTKFDLESYIKEMKAKHPRRSEYRIKNMFYMKNIYRDDLYKEGERFLDGYHDDYEEKLILYDGSCRVCHTKKDGRCTYPNKKPCRYPDERKYSMEAVGIEVIRTVINLKLDMEYPSNKYAYRFGLACFK